MLRLPGFVRRVETTAESGTARAPGWARMYFLMAVFDVLVVLISMFATHQLMRSFGSSVDTNRRWASDLGQIAELRRLAGDMNAPGNDVFDSRDPDAEAATMAAARKAFDRKLVDVRRTLNDRGENSPQLDRLLSATTGALDAMASEAEHIFAFFRQGEPQRAGERMATMDRKYADVNAAFAALESKVRTIQQADLAAQAATVGGLRRYEYLVGLFVLLMVSFATIYGRRIIRAMTRSAQEREAILAERDRTSAAVDARAKQIHGVVEEYAAFAARVAAGDLRARVSVDRDDEFVGLATNLNAMVDALGRVSQHVEVASSGVSATAQQILATVTEQSAATTQQALTIAETTGSVERVRDTAKSVASRARALVAQSTDAVHVTEQGAASIEAIVGGMREIQTQVAQIERDIMTVSSRSGAIADIAQAVNELADQSNMLALNATIEAARAGDHGKGFAVVADEVRHLAEQSKVATRQVQDILDEIHQATGKAVQAAGVGTRIVDEGAELADRAGDALRELAETVRRTAVEASEIAAAVDLQSSEIATISTAMSDVTVATDQLAEAANGSQQVAAALDDLARGLVDAAHGAAAAATATARRGADREPASV